MDAYKRVGRGGAGNYRPAKEVDAADKDLEAQEQNSTTLPVNDHQGSAHVGYARAGRGGAGNFYESSQAQEQERAEAEGTSAAEQVASRLKKHYPRGGGSAGMSLGGRGGAGNYSSAAAAQGHDDEQRQAEEGRKGDELKKKVEDAVDKGLRMPGRVHRKRDGEED